MTALLLGLLALALSGPVPRLLSRVGPLRAVPREALLLWQSVALSAVLAGLGAGLALTTEPLLQPTQWPRWLIAGFAGSVTALVAGRLLWTGHVVGTRLRSLRKRHRDLVDLFGSVIAGVSVLPYESPMAYCLPGWSSRVVVSDSTYATLSGEEVQAVLAHERAHLRARHDLVLEAFTVLHRAFPRWVSSRAALDEVQLLVEILADRAAVRRVGARPLARALACLATSRAPTAGLSAAGGGVVERIRLLADETPHRVLAGGVVTSALLVFAVPTLTLALPWLSGLPSVT